MPEEVTSGTINDNPWAGVVVVPNPSGTTAADDENTTLRPKTLTDWMLHTLVQICFFADVCACLLLLIYAAGMSCHQNVKMAWWALELAIVVGVRILSVTAALYYSHLVRWTGFIVASYASLIMAFQFLVALMVLLIKMPSSSTVDLFPCRPHDGSNKLLAGWIHALSESFQTLLPWLWLILLLAACLEFPVRWYLYRLYRFRLIWQQEQDEYLQPLQQRHQRRGRPWWWSSSSLREQAEQQQQQPNTNDLETGEMDPTSLRQALLDYDNNDDNNITTDEDLLEEPTHHRPRRLNTNGLPRWARETRPHQQSTTQSSSWWAFWRSGSTTSHNPRDDGSVDFASVQEEWASRSEEDPLWWSRENNNPQEAAATRVPDFVSTFSTTSTK